MSLTDKTPIKLPASIWLTVILSAAVAGGAWYSLKADVSQHTTDITDLKADGRIQRELLIRIDENVKELRRENRTHP